MSFPKAAAGAAATPAPVEEKLPEPQTAQQPSPKDLVAASELKTVTATPLKNNVVVNVKADGAIKDYKAFTIDGKQLV